MTSVRDKQFTAPECGQSTRFKLEMTVDSSAVPSTLNEVNQIAPSQLSLHSMK